MGLHVTLACASCGTDVAESEIDATTDRAHCLACGTMFSRHASHSDASQSFLPDPASAPDGVSFRYLEVRGASNEGHYRQQAGGQARLVGVEVSVSVPLSVVPALFALFVGVNSLCLLRVGTFTGTHEADSTWLEVVTAHAWIPILFAAIYAGLALTLRRPRLRLDRKGLRVRMGRLPWWGDRTIAFESLRDIYPVNWEEIIYDKRGRVRGRVTRYAICAALRDGRQRRLVALDERAQFVGTMLGEVVRELER